MVTEKDNVISRLMNPPLSFFPNLLMKYQLQSMKTTLPKSIDHYKYRHYENIFLLHHGIISLFPDGGLTWPGYRLCNNFQLLDFYDEVIYSGPHESAYQKIAILKEKCYL